MAPTTTGPTYWLLRTPEDLLNEYNIRQDEAQQCSQLTIRAFVFCQRSLLLFQRADGWNVPTLGFEAEAPDQLSIRDEVLLHLNKTEGIPLTHTRELQLMEFSQRQPLHSTYPIDDKKSKVLSISVILTTSSTLITKPLLATTRWANQDEILTLDIPAMQVSMTKAFDRQYIARAYQRLGDCTKASLPLADTQQISILCEQILLGILTTRYLTDGDQSIGHGWIALLDDVPGELTLVLFPVGNRVEAAVPCLFTNGSRKCRSIGVWGADGITWTEDVAEWQDAIDREGRLRTRIQGKGGSEYSVLSHEDVYPGGDAEARAQSAEVERWGRKRREGSGDF
ncbi:hypothetical protein PRZ48_008390 [Zasmidium cellare]|uniref:Uncharacterized protein n=1 Tax=Zasmidium cellare TaxID=395010 RepID=A0ABR0EFQ7_ZASCE|nr:hypothetical protein PRZ48_008390 [Zasmidium cellare]